MWDSTARHPVAAITFALLLSAAAVLALPGIDTQVDFVDAVPDHEGLDAYRELLQRLDGVRFAAVYMAHDETHPSPHLRDPDGFDALVREQEDLTAFMQERFPGQISHTLSAYEAMRAGHYMLEKITTAGNPRPEAYSVPDDPVRYQVVRDRTLAESSIDDVLARDGSSALMLVFFSTDDNLEARQLSGQVADALGDWRSPEGVTDEHQVSGLLYASHITDERNARDIPFWGAVALGGVALALLVVVRRPSGVLLSLACVGAATLWTFGTLGAFEARLSFLSVFLAPVIIGVGVDHAVHLLHRIEEDGDVRRATRRIGPVVGVAGITTAVGLSALILVPAPLFSEIGAVAALGIVWALVAALLIVPAARAMGRPRAPRPLPGGQALARMATAIHRRPAAAIAAVALITAGAVLVAATQTTIESGSSENEFPQDDPAIVLQQRIEKEYGAFQRAYIIVRGDLTDPAALRALHAASGQAADLPLYRNASSIADILLADEATDEGAADLGLGALLGATGQEPEDEERLPQTRAEARQRLDALFDDPLWRTIAPFTITREYDLAIVAIQVDPWEDQEELRALRDALQELAADVQAQLPGHDVAAGGSPVNRAAVVEQTPYDVAIATLGAALGVGIVLSIAWRRRGLDGMRVAGLGIGLVLVSAVWLLATVPLLDGTYRVLGTFNRAPLTDMFLLAFAVTVAVGIDDLVHLAARFWEARDEGESKADALQTSFRHAGRAITGTTLTTFVAFAVLSGVYFLQSKNLAILAAAGVLYAYVVTVLLAPPVLAGRRNS